MHAARWLVPCVSLAALSAASRAHADAPEPWMGIGSLSVSGDGSVGMLAPTAEILWRARPNIYWRGLLGAGVAADADYLGRTASASVGAELRCKQTVIVCGLLGIDVGAFYLDFREDTDLDPFIQARAGFELGGDRLAFRLVVMFGFRPNDDMRVDDDKLGGVAFGVRFHPG